MVSCKPGRNVPFSDGERTKRTSDDLDLGNSVGVTQDDTDLGGGGTLLGQLADLVDDLLGGGLEPRGGAAAVGQSRGRNSLSVGVKTTHLGGVVGVIDEKMARGRRESCRLSLVEGFGGDAKFRREGRFCVGLRTGQTALVAVGEKVGPLGWMA